MIIFDLDHTVIDSSHRAVTRADGTLDLDAWRACSTWEYICRDSLLPIAQLWRSAMRRGEHIIICTARVMTAADFLFLEAYGLQFNACLSRDGERDTRADWALKRDLLTDYAQSLGLSWRRFAADCVAYDDNKAILDYYTHAGILAHDAIELNKRLAQ